MGRLISRRKLRLGVVAFSLLALSGGIAYATIPDSGNVFTACMLNRLGTIRLIDPSLGSSSLLGHCTGLETQISWNQQGQKGDSGAPGPSGKNGADGVDGVSPTVAQLSPGDSHCATGGAAITDAAGTTAYVCNGLDGQNGKDGQPFSGTFTSPNKAFSISITDDGVEIAGPDATVSLPSSGGVAIKSNGNVSVQGNNIETVANNENTTVQGNRTETVGNDETISVAHDRTETVDNNETVTIGADRTENIGKDENVKVGESRTETVAKDESVLIGANRTETVGGALGLRASGTLSLAGALVTINDGTNCRPAARVGDLVDPSLTIITGSPTVCIG